MTKTLDALHDARSSLERAVKLHPGAAGLDEPTRLMLEAADLLDLARRMLTPANEKSKTSGGRSDERAAAD